MPLDYIEFAKKIKSKYPEYNDIDDLTLAKKMIEKYPEYKNEVSFDSVLKKKEVSQSTQKQKVTSSVTSKTAQKQPSVSSGETYNWNGQTYVYRNNAWEETALFEGNKSIPQSQKSAFKKVTDRNKIKQLNYQFKKDVSLDPIDKVYSNYDEEKKDNEYRVSNGNWQRKVPGASSWTTITNEGSVNALNRRYNQNVKFTPDLQVKKSEPKLKFADVNTSLVAKTEEDAVGTLSKKYGKYGFTFEQSGFGTDYITVYNKDKSKEITIGFDEKNPEEALKLKNFLEQNVSQETSSAYNKIKEKKNVTRDYENISAYDSEKMKKSKEKREKELSSYLDSEEYNNDFKSLSYDEMKEEVKDRISNLMRWRQTDPSMQKDLDKFYNSEAYKIYKRKKKEEFGARDERIDLLYTELQTAKASGNKAAIKDINSKITAYLTDDVIQDQVKNYSIQLNDLDNAAKKLAADKKKYLQSVEEFNSRAQSGGMTQEEFDQAKKTLDDQAESLSTRADFLVSSGKSIQKNQRKLNVVAGKYVTEKSKAGGFFGGVVNSFLTGISKSLVEVPLTLVASSESSKKYDYNMLSPEEKQYYKDKGYSEEETKNILSNERIRDLKDQSRKALTDIIGSDQTTKEYMKSKDRGFFEKAIYGVGESVPAMLMGGAGYAASFTGLAAQSYSSIEDEMLDDPDFKTLSVKERAVVAVPYAIAMGVLENYGLKNVVKGKSFTGGLVKSILSSSIKKMPKGASREVLQSIMDKEVKSLIAKGSLRIVNGAIAEFETGATQSLVLDIGLKSLYNKLSQSGMSEEEVSNLSGGEMFATPDSAGEIASTVLEDGLAEAIGGATIGTFTTVASGLMNGNISLYNEEDLEYLKEISQDSNFKKIIVANLKTEMLKGNLTKSEAQERLSAMNELASVVESIPDGLTKEDQIDAVNMLSEKNRLTREIQGKDPALVTAQTERINEINDELKTISKNAVQVETTGEVSVQPETTVSREVEEGEPQAKPQDATEKSQAIQEVVETEEDIKAKEIMTQLANAERTMIQLGRSKNPNNTDEVTYTDLSDVSVKDDFTPFYKSITDYLKKNNEVTIYDKANNKTYKFSLDGNNLVSTKVPNGTMQESATQVQEEVSINTEEDVKGILPQLANAERTMIQLGKSTNPNNTNEVTYTDLSDVSVKDDFTPFYKSITDYLRKNNEVTIYDKANNKTYRFNLDGNTLVSTLVPNVKAEATQVEAQPVVKPVARKSSKQNLVTQENVEELRAQQTTPKAQKIFTAAKLAMKALPGLKIYVHNTTSDFNKGIGQQSVEGAKGAYLDGEVHINLENDADVVTMLHEALHHGLLVKGIQSGAMLDLARGLKSVVSDKGLKQRLENFISNYDATEQAEEYVAELGAIMAEAKQELTTTKFQQFKNLINKIAQKLGLPVVFTASANAKNAVDFMNSLTKSIRTGQEVKAEEVKKTGKVKFQADFSDPLSKLTFVYDKNGEKFDQLKKEGFITDDKNLSDFAGKFIFLHQPDAAFSGMIYKDGELLVEGKGGVFYPIKFHDDGYFWASTATTAEKMAKDLNKVFDQNNGTIYMALTSAPYDKLMSSTTMANAILDFFSSKAFDNNFKLSPAQLKVALRKAANDIKIKKSKDKSGKVTEKKVGLDLKINANSEISDIQSQIKTALNPDNSSFADRKNFAEELIKLMADKIKNDPKATEQFGKLFSEGIQNKYFKGVSKTGKLSISAANMTQAISEMFTEPLLKEGIQRESGGQVYAIVELNGRVEPIDSDKHESYPKAIQSDNKNNKVKIHILQDRQNWADSFIDPETGETISEDRQKKLFPTSGVSVMGLQLKGPSKVKFQKASLRKKGLSDESIKTINENYTDKKAFDFYDFDWNKESKRDNFNEWLNNFESNQFDKNLSKVINLVKQDIDLLTEREIIKEKLKVFEELITSSIGSDILTKQLSIFEASILMDPNATLESIEKGFIEAKNIFDKDGNIDKNKITPSNIFKGEEISLPAFEKFIEKNPEYKGVFNDWKKIFDRDTELMLKETNAFSYDINLEKLENLYNELNTIKKRNIKFQKANPQQQEAIQKAKEKYTLSVEQRGNPHKQGVDAALNDLRKSDWYNTADDTQRENAERELKEFFGERLKKAPSVAKITGKPKANKVAIKDEYKAMVTQIKMEAKAAREAKADLNAKRKMLAAAISGMVKTGKIKASQAAVLVKRVSSLNLDNPVMVERFTNYAQRVFERADYQQRLDDAFKIRKGIRKDLKTDNQAEVSGMAKAFTKIDPSLVEDIDAYMEMADKVKNAVKPSRVKGLDVVMKESANIAEISEYTNEEITRQEDIQKKELLAIHDYLEDISKDMSLKEIQDIINLLKEKPNEIVNKEAKVKDFLKNRFDFMSGIIDTMFKTGIDPMTGEDITFDENQKDLMKRVLNIDLDEMSTREAIKIIEGVDNFINNQITSGLESAVSSYEGAVNVKSLVARNKVARPLRLFGPKWLGRFYSEQLFSLPMLMEKMFGGVTNSIDIMRKMGLLNVINGVNKANRQHSDIIDDFSKQEFAKGKDFMDAENIYEVGMLAELKRNLIGSKTEMQAEFNRRVQMLKDSIDLLVEEGNDKEKKMGELYKKVYDKLNVDSMDMDVINSNASKNNLEAVNWWINEWSKHRSELFDVSLSVYNTMLTADLNYTPDVLKTLSDKDTGLDENLVNQNGAFAVSLNNIDKNKSGVLMETVRQRPSNRYISLDFYNNNSKALKAALTDINTASAIRQVDGFLSSKAFNKLVPEAKDRALLQRRISNYIKRAKGKNVVPRDTIEYLNKFVNFVTALGVGKALAGFNQTIMQTAPVILNTFANAGRFDFVDADFNAWLNESGMPISNRGLESQSTIDSIEKNLDAKGQTTEQILKGVAKVNQWWLRQLLVKPDVWVARSSFKSYYLQNLKRRGISTEIDWKNHKIDKEAAEYAQIMIDRQQNISDPMLAGEFLASEEPMRQIARKIFIPFASFILNQKARMYNDMMTITSKTASREDRFIAARSLYGLSVELLAYQMIGFGIRRFYDMIAASLLGDEDDEETKKKKFINATKYPIKSIVNDIISPIPLTDDLVTIGLNEVLAQYPWMSDKEIKDAVKERNRILELKGDNPMDAKAEEEYINKIKEEAMYQVYRDDNERKYGMIGIAGETYKEVAEISKLYATGEFTDEYKGRETKKKLLEADRKDVGIAVLPMMLYSTGLLTKDVGSIGRNYIKRIKKKAITEKQYERYDAVQKDLGRNLKSWEIDIVKSKKESETAIDEIKFIERNGGLTERQGREYLKVMKAIGEPSIRDIIDIKDGKTADQILK